MRRRRRTGDYWTDVVLANAPSCTCAGSFNPHCPINADIGDPALGPGGVANKHRTTASSVKEHMVKYIEWCKARGLEPDGMVVLNAVAWGCQSPTRKRHESRETQGGPGVQGRHGGTR